jgi:hypothetical protein
LNFASSTYFVYRFLWSNEEDEEEEEEAYY